MTDNTTTRRILVPLDGSDFAEQTIPFAATIAGANEEIVLLHVAHEKEPIRDLLGRIGEHSISAKDKEIQQSNDLLEAAADRWSSVLAAAPRLEVVVGDPETEILATVERLGCNLIIAATKGRGAVGRLAFGSVADKLARESKVPVMLVRPRDAEEATDTKPEITRILVPYDGSDLATEAFPTATALAKQLSAKVHMIYAINPSVLMPIATPMEPNYPVELYDQLIQETESEAKSSLDLAKNQLSNEGVNVSYEITTGTPFDSIVERAHSNDIIVISSHGRTGIKRWLLGSVAEKLVRESPVPVVVVPSTGRHEAPNE